MLRSRVSGGSGLGLRAHARLFRGSIHAISPLNSERWTVKNRAPAAQPFTMTSMPQGFDRFPLARPYL